MQKISIFWFRRDFRLVDNSALHHALQGQNPVLPIFIFDSEILDDIEDQTDARVSFIYQAVLHIKAKLQRVGTDLRVYYGSPVDIFKKITKEFEVNQVYTNRDYEPYAQTRDNSVDELLRSQGIGFHTFKDHVIFEKQEIMSDSKSVYKVFTPYSRKWKTKLHGEGFRILPNASKHTNWLRIDSNDMITLASIGFKESSIPIPSMSVKNDLLINYEASRNYPAQNGTSKLGIHLRFGTISIRQAIQFALDHSETWLNQLIWRDFYIQVLYNFPHVVDSSFKPQYDKIPWRHDEKDFQLWCEGKTGYPIVDAGMRQLNHTGYMHNRVRMVVASFLTKHLLIDWRWGEAYFASKLLDFELAANNGGWQWAAGTGTDAQPYFRVFNPQSQLEKFDQKLDYVKEWVQEYGTDEYPKPMVEHKMARQRAIDTYKTALA